MNPLQIIKANITHLLLLLTLIVTAGDVISAAQQPKSASQATAEAIKTSTADYPWSDRVDFENARRGFIAPLNDGGEIKDAAGKDIWNLAAYQSFIKDGTESPNTVNPSLWRMSQLLMYSGLFQVVPGVYQVRGADLSNITIIESGSGITIYDPLISAEAARAALELCYQHRPRKPVVAAVYSHSHADHGAL
jgi:alkyl sulfatase BDS1-like metallo-beta-lactamase superfamily hydrolase